MVGSEDRFPTHQEIEKRAYELYLKDGEQFSPVEYWLRAEEELKQQPAAVGFTARRRKSVVAGAGGVAKTDE